MHYGFPLHGGRSIRWLRSVAEEYPETSWVTGCVMSLPGERAATWSRPSEAVWWFLCGRCARAAAPVALVVGTILSAVNQGHLLLAGDVGTATWIRIAVNYVVPFCVASIGFLSACRVKQPPRTAGEKGEE